MKKIVFFDADGTLWYPKSTKYEKHPVWVYKTYPDIDRARQEFTLIPGVIETLENLKKSGVKLVILSTNPKTKEEANAQMKDSAEYFGLSHLFDEIHGTRPEHGSKGEYILEILKKYDLKKKDALMVGDSYEWDYSSARGVRVDGVLIDNNYENRHKHHMRVRRKIKNFEELMNFIN